MGQKVSPHFRAVVYRMTDWYLWFDNHNLQVGIYFTKIKFICFKLTIEDWRLLNSCFIPVWSSSKRRIATTTPKKVKSLTLRYLCECVNIYRTKLKFDKCMFAKSINLRYGPTIMEYYR